MDMATLTLIAALILSFLAAVFNRKWTVAKNKIHQIRVFLETLDQAVQDDKITTEEAKDLINQLKKICGVEDGKRPS